MASKTSIIKKQNNTKTNPIYKIASKVYNLNELLKKEVEKLLSSYDIGFAELDLLIVLHEADKKVFKPSDLYDKLQFSSGGITKIIKRLEIKHYIKKEVFLEDLRSKPISITKKGQSLVLELFPKVIHLEKNIFSVLEFEELNITYKSLLKVIKSLK
ncbi:MarR family winged helix-turn-helix transcriptional regulator [Malaciobacter marinus]|jgi:DNA-binding MarR family transcriptional regulator|uniref:HTH-type transcriptional regulator SarZ n=1 Tax=Malaciobacter marinus TaxID=505249 RepID=A0AB36ZUX5_9BACT|nr:MarR family transcriptional regulator [Malaciobacter marinus]PPK60613.1 MarR family transcriptional regulator [Malaciobacter marinus]SKB55027.1 DNA-binding transcriptional regulator, MarR family [Malaciobacter marinus]